MRTILLSIAIVLGTVMLANAQKIESKKVFGGYQYTYNGETMNFNELKAIMKPVPKAYGQVKKARTKNTISAIIGSLGGGLIGYPLGQSLAGGDANWTLAGIGAGLVVVGIPISSSANKNAQKAVELYNSSVEEGTSTKIVTQIKIIGNREGIGLTMTF